VWFRNNTLSERKSLQGFIKTAERITGSNLPSIDTLYTQRCRGKPQSILKDKRHPAHALFGWRNTGYNLRHHRPESISTHKARYHNSFFPAAVRLVAKDINMGGKYFTPQLTD
jgi:hypothetical protein